MNQQNPNNPVRRTVQPRRAGGQAGVSGGQPQANTQFGFGAPQQQQPQLSQQQPLYGQENPYIMPTQPVADQQQPYQSVAAAGQLSEQAHHFQQSVVQPGMAQVAPVTLHEQQWADPTYTNASLGQRAGAYLIDALIIGLIQFVIYVIFVGGGSAAGSDEAVIGGMIISAILMFILGFAYKVCLEGAMGQTLGKKILGLRLITTDGRPMGFGHAVKRNINLFYSLVPFIGSFAAGIAYVVRFFSVMNSPYNQGYHDRWGNTRLIKEH